MKKAFLIHYDGYYDIRLKNLEKTLVDRGYKVTLLFSDFDHYKKEKKTYSNKNIKLIHVNEYKKNISLRRIISYLSFAKQIKKIIRDEVPDLIYAIIPPNTLAHVLGSFKSKNPNTKVIFDVFDLYPEQMPKLSNTIVAKFWGNIRNKNLKKVDYVVLECSYYKNVLSKYLNENKSSVLYLNRPKIENPYEFNWNDKQIDIVYLGSINHHIDIDKIVSFLKVLNKRKKVVLHIIGDGEKAIEFNNRVQAQDIETNFYGIVFDDKKKREILQKCQYGLNVYRKNLGIGLTMKSVEYYQIGLPIINAGIYDSKVMIEKFGAGFSLESEEELATKISNLTHEEWSEHHSLTLKVFEHYFCTPKYRQNLIDILERVISE
ncbi:glycosyltransferase family 4 protein [Lactococcus piscium]|nr:glycosyltransferase [Lactococcus paracarnosus]MCJ1993299.1 glycosyltransferase family 4 protein [Lactococcus paracarnosus]SPC37271.1 conserved hypothetical protein [Lactococcus piscium]